jgi:ATP-dependent Clp protease, protease subunit
MPETVKEKKEPKETKVASAKGDLVTLYVNHFDEESARTFFEEFKKARENEQEVVPVYIDSYGGYVDALSAMLDVMLSFPGKVATICMGKAMSCGSILLACGENGMRYASPNSRVLVHQISSMSWGPLCDLEVSVKETRRLQNQIFRLMATRCNQPSDYFLKLIRSVGNVDIYMTPQEAKGHKIIDHIKYPIIKTEKVTKVTFD